MSGKQAANRDQDRTRAHQPRTISMSRLERGQTTQDFVVGIGVFLLAIAFVFSFFPALVTPYDSSVGGAETAQADRIADRIVNDTSTGTPNELSIYQFENKYMDKSESDLIEPLGIRGDADKGATYDNVNIRIELINGSDTVVRNGTEKLTTGPSYDNQSAASSARIITFNDESDLDPGNQSAYRLVVRVW